MDGGTSERRARYRVHRGEAPGVGAWEYAELSLDPELAPLVRRCVAYRDQASRSLRRRELPFPGSVLVVELDTRWRLYDPDDGALLVDTHSFAAAIGERAGVVENAGASRCYQVDFTPLGARRFFGLPMHQVAGRVLALEELLGNELERLRCQLSEQPDWGAGLRCLSAFLRSRLRATPAVSLPVAWAVTRLEQSGGAQRIEQLASELGWSRKRLRDRFRVEVGLPAKQLAQLLRFERAVDRLRSRATAGEAGLAALALACGYADQAHLSREFRRFAGQSPREYLRTLP